MNEVTFSEPTDFTGFTRSDNKYAILGVSEDAPAEAIKMAFRRLAFQYHPDRHQGGDKQSAEDIFKRINAAYQTLSDPVARRDYDLILRQGATASIKEEASERRIDPLAQILEGVLRYKYIFNSEGLNHFEGTLRKMVRDSLIGELREQIVGIIPILVAPSTYEFQGTFKSGAIILTNLRILLPFWSEREETVGNTKTTYSHYYLPSVTFAEIQQVRLRVSGRISKDLTVALDCEKKKILLDPIHRNLSKLLLLCSLWGVPVLSEEDTDTLGDIVSAVFGFPFIAGSVYTGLNGLAFLCGLCDGGPLSAVRDLNETLWEMGILQVVLVVAAGGMGLGIRSSLSTYGCERTSDLIEEMAR